jgi:hypothetical protein
MARNGSGTYVLPAGNPVTTGTTISSTWANTTLTDIGSALTTSISNDGQTVPTANLPMGNYAHTGVANASVRTQYASAAQVQDGALEYLGAVSGTDTITASAAVGMSTYTVGQTFRFVSAGANTTTAVTININGIGAKNITKNGATALAVGDIPSGAALQIVYDGTQFQLTGIIPSSATSVTTFSAGTTGFTPSTATSGAVTLAGTLAIANGGTANNALAVTAGGTLYTDGTKLVNVGAGTSGQYLKSNGASAPTWASVAVSGTLINIQYFTSTATYTPTSGTTFVVVEVVGGGGGGGTASATTGAGGGGSGGYARKKITSSFSGVTVTVGGAASTSSFGALVSATGGSNGTNGASGGNGGGAGVGSSGDLNLTGGKGTGSGSNNSAGGNGGATFLGGAGGGGAFGGVIGSAGSPNTGAGGGGGGVSNAAGGAGGSGIVIVYEYA